MSPVLEISSDERVAVLGQTRMGKTFLMEFLAEQQPRVIVVDSKGRVNWKGYHLTTNPQGAFLADKVIYRPEGGAPPEEWWPEAVQSLIERGGGVIIVDEMSYIVTVNRITKGLSDAFRLGGEQSVGVWYCAQESTAVHNTTLRQAGLIIMFYNQGASDREKLAAIVGDMAHVTAYLPKYQFVVFVRGETYDRDAIPTYMVEA